MRCHTTRRAAHAGWASAATCTAQPPCASTTSGRSLAAAGAAATPPFRARRDPSRRAGERRQRGIELAVEAGRARADDVRVAERRVRARARAPRAPHRGADSGRRGAGCASAASCHAGSGSRGPVTERTAARVFVLPTSTSGQLGPVAAWMSTAGWAAAARRVLGDAWIVTPAGEIEPEAARRRGSAPRCRRPRRRAGAGMSPRSRRRPPRTRARTRAAGASSSTPTTTAIATSRSCGSGTSCSTPRASISPTRSRVPSVLFVPATHVWEAEQWGVHRPGWRGIAERYGEASGAAARRRRRVRHRPRRRTSAAPRCRVRGDRRHADRCRPRRVLGARSTPRPCAHRLGLDGRFVVGWVGSFRPFHALEQAIDALRGVADATLLLVGDGPERPRIEADGRGRGASPSSAPARSRTPSCRNCSPRWTSRSCSRDATRRSTTRR